MNLLDANVWLAGIWEGHADHAAAARWRVGSDDRCAMCRVTQMAVLRHLTNAAIMGADALTRRDAWNTISRQLADPSVLWLDEPPGLEDAWRRLSSKGDRSHSLWTDDYLAALAETTGARLVTFDRAWRARYATVDVVVL